MSEELKEGKDLTRDAPGQIRLAWESCSGIVNRSRNWSVVKRFRR